MLRDVLFVGRHDLRQALRARETLMWVFVMPILFFWFIGSVTGGFAVRPSEDRPDPMILEVPEDAGFLARSLERRLADQFYEAIPADTTGRVHRRLTIPPAFTDSVLAGVPSQVRYRYGNTGLGGDYERLRVGRAVYTVLADYLVAARDSAGATSEAMLRVEEMPRAMTVDVKAAGRRKVPPVGFAQAVPGIMVMFTLLVMTTAGAVLLVIERRQGLLRRLASAPIDRGSIVAGKWIGRLAIGLVQIAFAMLAGSVLFKMDWGSDLPAVFGVMFVYAALMASVGLLLGSVARTEGQAVAIGVISSNVLGALGGCWWPIEITPPWMQKLALFLPTGWAMDALHKLVAFGAGPGSVLPHVIGMAIATAVLIAAASRLFRFE